MDGTAGLEGLASAAFRCDEEGWVVAANSRCAELFSGTESLLCGSAVASLFPNEPRVAQRLAHSGGDSIRLQARRLSGAAFHVEAQATTEAGGILTCVLWDVLGAAPPRTARLAARTR